MTIRGERVSTTEIIISALGLCISIIIGFMAYFMKDMSESMRSVREDVAVMKFEMKATSTSIVKLSGDLEDTRSVLYAHIVDDKD